MDKKEMRNLFDGDCSPAEEQIAGRWLAEHAETKEADELLYALLRETKPATADAEGAFRRVCRRLGIAPKSSAWRLVGRWTMRAAACLLLPVAALAFYLYGEAQRPGEWFEAYAPYGKTLRVVLPDGSEVVINSGSKLIYPDRFGPDRRQVFLAGEGYATIAKDPGRPFVMSAGEVDVRVLGTKFNVVAEEENGLFSTALFEGRVAVSSRLVPGERLVLEPGKIHGAVEECRSESHSGGGQCGYGEDDGACRSGRCGGGRHGKRWTYRFHHDHGAGSAGSGCGIYPGDRSWRYRRWQRNGGGFYAGSGRYPDGHPVRRIKGIHRP